MKPWKAILPIMLSGGLVACSSTPTEDTEVQTKPQVEETQPEMVDGTDSSTVTQDKAVTESEKEVESTTPKQEVEPEVKPEPKPEARPLPKKTVEGKLILGEEEYVRLADLKITTKSRIDTGATTSSLSAVDIVPFERDGKDWVKFKIKHDGVESKEINLPVQRWVKVKQSSSDGTDKRAVVSTVIQIGDMREKTEFTLADRTHLKYPVLLGRSFFRDVAVVDVSRKYVQPKPSSK